MPTMQSKSAISTERDLENFRFPAEWEAHEATWLSWPHADGISFPGSYEQVMPTFVAMVRALSTSENVCINVRDAREEAEVRRRFSGTCPASVRFFHIPTNEPWCRDHGPIFLVDSPPPGDAKRRIILDWGFNAWGGKYPPFDKDNDVPTAVGKNLGIATVKLSMVLEGGSIDVNGAGTIMTTESCLLNPNRNPHLTRGEIEENLRKCLGARQVLWLGDGIEGDDTDGHVDDLSRFVAKDTVVTMVEEDPRDANYEPLLENYNRLIKMKLWDGTPLKVIKLFMPRPVVKQGSRLPASYANFYIANRVVLLPVFNDSNDEAAIRAMQQAFPDRKIVPLNCRELVWGLGTFHCLTQQQPAV